MITSLQTVSPGPVTVSANPLLAPFTGASALLAGAAGFVPQPLAGQQGLPLLGSGAFGQVSAANVSGLATVATSGAYSSLSGLPSIPSVPAGVASADVVFVIDGAGNAISTGTKGFVAIDFAATIAQWTLIADQSGSAVLNVWKCTYAQYDGGATHPVSGDSITASSPPTLSAAAKAQSSTLAGWTTAVNAGDILAFNVGSASSVTKLTVILKVIKS
jgi:hypothetical protein